MADAGISHKALARAVRTAGAADGLQLGTDHTAVSRWLGGMVPRQQTVHYLLQVLSVSVGRTITAEQVGMGRPQAVPRDLGLTYVETTDNAIATVGRLWTADLAGDDAVNGSPDVAAWSDVAFRWLVGRRTPATLSSLGSRRVGASDVAALRETTDAFAELDNRFGGAHVRTALVSYLAGDVAEMLTGRHANSVRRDLFVAAAEATLLAAWMAYDSCQHGLAQRYFIQALRLADAGDDRALAASVLSAMSHQATFIGQFREGADLARAAVAGVTENGSETLRAQFHAMEARALARLGDARACDAAMGDALKHFERRNVQQDPAWIGYFDEAELSAELGHCHRDLNRAPQALLHASVSLSPDGSYVRSDFFATMVLADSYALAGEVEQALAVAARALELGQSLKSARCRSYVMEFKDRIAIHGPSAVFQMNEQYAGHRLWNMPAVA